MFTDDLLASEEDSLAEQLTAHNQDRIPHLVHVNSGLSISM